ncbi:MULTISPECIES: pantoate--beta-alanine ligase [Anaerococcus]|uniref:pantoate--beta-alanine ligase n=1 Tax=Anaerococcus TaxID=165779 RepID=UPI001AE5B42A|nr:MULTISPECIES: pantoate--beta-alanine ligase [Anaerococcus]MBP2070135.1 pantoate--beta-alanine ligase [Anaerococcus nagyae]MDU1828723.1 pantoate--beta-alanine ligase [Anaerococcus sp.]MDU1865306.1 pantoate--beta-alanine ligase [Anaerococcus sp.]MDU2353380.1 pantoate--beta-alanine ligase [Anaerococcus sp.]MDU3211670.1 pantoate--beta-alanine ligase [Anaerococcus sp.]
MKIVKSIDELRKDLKGYKLEGKSIGLVPTMGFLHEGHASLIRKARAENDIVVVSDFINPIQFGPKEDLKTYPRDLESDSKLCENIGVDFIFAPEASEMYHDRKTFVDIEDMSNNLCGAKRPGHFRGVCTVCTKLFNITGADRAYFGQKDAQQVAIIKKVVFDLNIPIEIIPCPIVREDDGLALSSRNTYLSDKERKAALCLSKAIFKGEELAKNGASVSEVLEKMKEIISSEKLAKIDYISAVDLATMKDSKDFADDRLIAIAVFIGKTRLIDNFIYRV